MTQLHRPGANRICKNCSAFQNDELSAGFAALRAENDIVCLNEEHHAMIEPLIAAPNVEKNFFNHDLLVPELYRMTPNLVLAQFECMKNYPAFHLVNNALRNKTLRYGDTVIESSSGSMAYGLAQAWSNRINPLTGRKDNRLVIITDIRVDPCFIAMLEQLGAEVHVVSEKINGGHQIPRLNLLYEKMAEIRTRTGRNALWVNQYDNLALQDSYAPLARHMDLHAGQAMGGPVDIVVATVGTGCSASGIGRALKRVHADTRVVFVDLQGSSVLGRKANKNKYMIGAGNSIKCGNVDYAVADEAHWVDADQAVHQMLELRKRGVNAGYTTGAAYQAGEWLARENPGKRVFVIGPDYGDRYLANMSDANWLVENGIAPAPLAIPEDISAGERDHYYERAHGWQYMVMDAGTKTALEREKAGEVAARARAYQAIMADTLARKQA